MTVLVHEARRDARRGRMLDAATQIFARRPFAQVSMDQIAREAGVGKPTLYRYFDGKDALFLAVFERALDALERRLDLVLAQTRTIAGRLPRMVREIAPTFRDHLVSLRLLGAESTLADLSKRRLFRDRRARIADRIASCIRGGVARGELRTCRPEGVAEMVIGMIWSATATDDGDDEAIASEVTDLVLHGLLPPERRARPEAPAMGRLSAAGRQGRPALALGGDA